MLDGDIFQYEPDGRVLTDFFWDRSPVAIIQGPVGSGTSTACCHRIFCTALEQKPDKRGWRKCRVYIVRNTFSKLKETTIKTWKYWFETVAEGHYGEVTMSNPPKHVIKSTLPDGTMLEIDVTFLALDNEDDVAKLLSAEPTIIWFNEVQFIDKAIFSAGVMRSVQGRYPPKLDGGPSYCGVIADLNAPPLGHFVPYFRGDVPIPEDWSEEQRKEFERPDDWSFFVQPPGLIEVFENGKLSGYAENNRENRKKHQLADLDYVAENMKWIDVPYMKLIEGQSKSFIDTFVMNRVGQYRAGKPVFESFRREVHVAKSSIEYNPNLPLIVGIDFARNPAMVICQELRGALYVLDEYGVVNEAATTYAPKFRSRLMKKFPQAFTDQGGGIQFWGDPTGDSKGQGTDKTPYAIFSSHGMQVYPCSNTISLRLNAVDSLLNKMVDGGPGLLISPPCVMLTAAMDGGYHFAKIKGVSNGYHEEPNKRVRDADFADALQYATLGAGFGNQVLTGGKTMPKPVKLKQKGYSLKRRA